MRPSPSLLVVATLVAASCSSAAAPDGQADAPAGGTTPDAAAGSAAGSAADGAIAPAVCTGRAATTGDAAWTLTSGGMTRAVTVHVPPRYDPAVPTPIVLNFHGYGESSVSEASLSRMDARADASGFVVIYPTGTGEPASFNAGACCGTAEALGVDDVQFTRDVIDAAAAKLCVDPKRIYATGMSNGGFLAHRIGCELADRVAAIAPVAGVLGIASASCTPVRPMPVMEFDGTADAVVPWAGSTELGFISVADSIAGWVARDHCTGAAVPTYGSGDSACATYESCAGGAEVTLCTITGGGHTWPGGEPVPELGYTTTDLSATDAMWAFFAAHPLP